MLRKAVNFFKIASFESLFH